MGTRILGMATTVVLVLAGAVACSGDDEPSAPSSSSSSSTGEPTETPETPETSEPTTEPTQPAGTRYDLDGLSFVLPEPYRAFDERDVAVLAKIGTDDPVAYIEVTTLPSTGDMSLAQTRQLHLDVHFYESEPEFLDPVTVGGVRMFHLAGQTDEITWTEAFGTDETGVTIDVLLEFRVSVPEAERQQVIDAVLGSVEITS